MAKGTTRAYEVPVTLPLPGSAEPVKQIYLVDATSVDAARNFVAAKFVGAPKAANGRRVGELMTAGVKIETAKPETPPPANDTPPGGA